MNCLSFESVTQNVSKFVSTSHLSTPCLLCILMIQEKSREGDINLGEHGKDKSPSPEYESEKHGPQSSMSMAIFHPSVCIEWKVVDGDKRIFQHNQYISVIA
jgi:hypothetical protein